MPLFFLSSEKRPDDDLMYVAMYRRWKLLYRPTHPKDNELYDLASDPHERENVYRADHAEAGRLKQHLARSSPWVTEPFSDDGAAGLGANEMRALEALGYVRRRGAG